MFGSKFANKCKHAMKCVKSRVDPIRKKKQAMLRFLKKDVADLLANGHDINAFGRIEALIIEINQASCYDMIEQFCEIILKQLSPLQKQRDCPQGATEAVSTIIFAAARFPDLPELCDLRYVFTARYESNMESFVNAEFVEKIQKKSFSKENRLQMMQNIAEEFSVRFDLKALELKLSNPSGTKPDQPKIGTSFPKENEKPSSMLPTGHKDPNQKQQKQLEPRDIHIILNDDQVQKTGKVTANELENMAPLNMKSRCSHKEIKNDDQLKDAQVHNRTLKVQERPGPIYNQGEQEISPKRHFEDKSSKAHTTYTKYKLAENREHVERNGFIHNRSEMDEDDFDSDKKSKGRLGYFRIKKKGVGSEKSSTDKAIEVVPPYTNNKGTKSEHFVEEENGSPFSYDRLSTAPELEPYAQDRQPARPLKYERAVNRVPPYVKSTLSTESANEDQGSPNSAGYDMPKDFKDRYNLKVHDKRPTPASVRRKFAKPPAIDNNDEAFDNGKLVSENPSGGGRHTGRRGSTINADKADGNLMDRYPRAMDGEVDTAADHAKLLNLTPGGQRRTTSRWNKDSSDDRVNERTRDDEEDNVINYGRLANRSSNGQRKYGTRTSTYDGECHEEKTEMDQLLMHHSKKSSANKHAKTRTRTKPRRSDHMAEECGNAEYHDNRNLHYHPKDSLHHRERAAYLPEEPVSPVEVGKGNAHAMSFQPELLAPNRDCVHPRMPDYDELAARINALKKA